MINTKKYGLYTIICNLFISIQFVITIVIETIRTQEVAKKERRQDLRGSPNLGYVHGGLRALTTSNLKKNESN